MQVNDVLQDDRHEPGDPDGRIIIRYIDDASVVLERASGGKSITARDQFVNNVRFGRYTPTGQSVESIMENVIEEGELDKRQKIRRVNQRVANDDTSNDGDSSVEKDDFTQISGVGDKTAQNLYDKGFNTITDLQEAETDELMSTRGFGQKALSALSVGSVPVEELPGVGATVAERLRNEGYETKQDVIDGDEEDLLSISGVGQKLLEVKN